jgi:AcrR family transcriptional regulator
LPRLNLTEEETRRLIQDEARRLFLDIGYEKTTIADIAKACGFSTANVHRVFGTKAQIREACAEEMLMEKLGLAEEAIGGEATAPARLRAFVHAVHGFTRAMLSEEPRMHSMVAAAVEERWEAITRYRLRLLKIERAIVRDGARCGEFDVADPDRAALALHMMLKRVFHPLLIAEMEEAPDAGEVDLLIDFALRALGAKAAESAA